jgi:hypothetical protein
MENFPAVWRKSTLSGSNGCIEVAFVGAQVAIRQSKDPSGPVLTFSPTEWEAFLAGVRRGEFDAPARPAQPSIG